MEAFSKGFLPVVGQIQVATPTVPPDAIEDARGITTWGSVFLMELPNSAGTAQPEMTPQPLLLADVIACWAPSAEATAEVAARMETFDDTVASAVPIAVDQGLFPQATNAAGPLSGDLDLGNKPSVPNAGAQPGEPVAPNPELSAIEKLSGEIAMARARADVLGLPLPVVARLISPPALCAPTDGPDVVEAFAAHAYHELARGADVTEDSRIYTLAAAAIGSIGPVDGIDPIAFAKGLSERLAGDASASATISAFLATLSKVLGNRIELSESNLDDSGKVGQRALLLFCLAPTTEQLDKWLKAKRVGPDVSMLASILSGTYCGMGGIPSAAKAPTREAFLSAVVVARAIARNSETTIETITEWDQSAVRHDRIIVRGMEFAHRATEPDPSMAEVIRQLRVADAFSGVNRSNGTVQATLADTGIGVVVTVDLANFRVPASQVVRFVASAMDGKRGQHSRDLLARLCDPSLHPVVATARPGTRDVILEIEADIGTGVQEALSLVAAAAKTLKLAPAVGVTTRVGREAKHASDTRKSKSGHKVPPP